MQADFQPKTYLRILQSRDKSIHKLLESLQAKESSLVVAKSAGDAGEEQIKILAAELKSLRKTIKEQLDEIELLHNTAAERLEVIQKLDVALTQSRRTLAELSYDPTKVSPDLTMLTDEVSSLRIKLGECQSQLKHRNSQCKKLEQLVNNNSDGSVLSGWKRLVNHWQRRLAESTPHPLAKLQQYSARELQPESFPQPASRIRWPRICIATPSYQQAPFLERTILSVLDQNYPNLAYGVQDGGSTDGSAELITRYLTRLTHAESRPDQGQSDAIRRGFAKLFPETKDIMGWLNSDDTLMPGALHYVGAYFARHPEVDVVYGHRVVIDEQDREIGRWFMPKHHADTLKWFDLVPQETMFWRAQCYQDIGGLDESFQFALDWDILLRFEQAGCSIQRLPYFLGCFRVHPQQKTSAHIKSVGEFEMQRLRRRTHNREVFPSEINRHLTAEINRSAMVEWLHRHGVRY